MTLRLDPELWRRFGELTDDRSAVLRDFVKWYVRDLGTMPKRPGTPARERPPGTP